MGKEETSSMVVGSGRNKVLEENSSVVELWCSCIVVIVILLEVVRSCCNKKGDGS